jgi:rfaE bifunctional protein nucleotidyltransferase chain/domain
MDHFIASVDEKELELVNQNNDIEVRQNERIDYKKNVCIKPWGHEFLVYESKKIGIWCLTMYKGQSTSIHCHFKKDTVLIILSGCARIEYFNGEVTYLSRLQTLFIPKKKFHSIGSFSEKTCILEIEVFSNDVDFSDKNDLLRVHDQYHRKPTGYQTSVTLATEGLEKYDYFEISHQSQTIIDGVLLSTSTTFQPHTKNTIQILLEGNVLQGNYVIKEGSILHPDGIFQALTKLCILSITKHDWKEDTKVIHDAEQLRLVKKQLDQTKQKIILTSGCFDILHVGHLTTLKKAKALGDILIVCLSSDEQIRILKGDSRPINKFEDRLGLFKTIECVDYIYPYEENYIETEETLGSIMKILDPDVWVKGSDYTIEAIKEKHPYLRKIKLFPLVEDRSTTNIIKKIEKDFKN